MATDNAKTNIVSAKIKSIPSKTLIVVPHRITYLTSPTSLTFQTSSFSTKLPFISHLAGIFKAQMTNCSAKNLGSLSLIYH